MSMIYGQFMNNRRRIIPKQKSEFSCKMTKADNTAVIDLTAAARFKPVSAKQIPLFTNPHAIAVIFRTDH